MFFANSWFSGSEAFLDSELGKMALGVCSGLLIFGAGWLLARYLSAAVLSTFGRTKLKKDLQFFFGNFIFYGVLVVTTMAALSEMGVDTNSLLAVMGGGALAVGLGLKDQLSQLAAGIALLIKHPFRVGDFVMVGGQLGKVESVDFFQTVLKTPDSRKVILPNSLAQGSVIINYSGFHQRRIDLPLLISYSDDIEVARNAVIATALETPNVLPEPAPVVLANAMKDSGVELMLRCWVDSPNYADTRFALIERTKTAVEGAGCTIPFTQIVVHKA